MHSEELKPTFWWLKHAKMALFAKWRASFWAAWCKPREPRRLKRDIKLSCTSPLTVPNMLFVVLDPLWAPQHLLREAQIAPLPNEASPADGDFGGKCPKKKIEKSKCLPCTGNTLTTFQFDFRSCEATKIRHEVLTMGSKLLQSEIFDLRF